MLKEHLPRVVYHQVYEYTKISQPNPLVVLRGLLRGSEGSSEATRGCEQPGEGSYVRLIDFYINQL